MSDTPWEPPLPGAPRVAAFFDLDKTVIAKSSTYVFAKPFLDGGLMTRRAVLRNAYGSFLFHAGGADHDQMERMRSYLSNLVTGWEARQVREIVSSTVQELIAPVVYGEATTLIAQHQAQGHDVVIVSASGSELVEPIAAMLGADDVIATRLAVQDGRYTGQIDFYAYAENKASAIAELAQRRGYDLAASYAYSDSATDLPMLACVGNPFAVNPDRVLREHATAQGWPVLEFSNPVRLRDRVARISPPTPTGLSWRSGAALAGALVVAWAIHRASRGVHPASAVGRRTVRE